MEKIYRHNGQIMLDDYFQYLDKHKSYMTSNVREFVFAPHHYDITDSKCPHDSWIESINIIECGSGQRMNQRSISIHAQFLGAYQNGYFEIKYVNVVRYHFGLNRTTNMDKLIGHGDWIVDEVTFLDEKIISHEIEFSLEGVWKIHCKDIIYSWTDIF